MRLLLALKQWFQTEPPAAAPISQRSMTQGFQLPACLESTSPTRSQDWISNFG